MMQTEDKLWGTKTIIYNSSLVQVDKLEIKKGYRCSRHKHFQKFNRFQIETGRLKVYIQKHFKAGYKPNHIINNDPAFEPYLLALPPHTFQQVVVRPGLIHWFEAEEDTTCYEISFVKVFDNDIYRLDTGGVIVQNVLDQLINSSGL